MSEGNDMNRYEVQKGVGRNAKNRGDVGGTGTRWFVIDTTTGLRMPGLGRDVCKDGGFLRKHQAEAFIAALQGR